MVNGLPSLKTMPLDMLEADLATTNAAEQQKTYELQNTAPIIYYSMTPAVLALIDGQPTLAPTADNMQKVVNTRALVIFDPKKGKYYLALMDGWMEAAAVQGPWTIAKHAPTKSLPASIALRLTIGPQRAIPVKAAGATSTPEAGVAATVAADGPTAAAAASVGSAEEASAEDSAGRRTGVRSWFFRRPTSSFDSSACRQSQPTLLLH